MNQKLFKNLLIFSDGSFNLDFNTYNSKKITYLIEDFKKNQEKFKKQSLNITPNSNSITNYRKKLFK